FEATAAGAEWIDQLAQAAKNVRDSHAAKPVIAHCDWSARNVRMDETGLLAVYDWDSLSIAAEVVAVGQAAATWSAVDGGQPAPSANEVATYVARYEDARGARFGPAERVAVAAAALYVLASPPSAMPFSNCQTSWLTSPDPQDPAACPLSRGSTARFSMTFDDSASF